MRTIENSPYSSGQILLASCQNDAGHVRGNDSRTELAHLGDQMRKHFPHEARHRLSNSRACQDGTGATQPPPEVPQQSIRIAALAEDQVEREAFSPSTTSRLWLHAPVVVLGSVMKPVTNELLEHFEGRSSALRVQGRVQKGSPFQLAYDPCLGCGVDCHVVQLDLYTHTSVRSRIHHLHITNR